MQPQPGRRPQEPKVKRTRAAGRGHGLCKARGEEERWPSPPAPAPTEAAAPREAVAGPTPPPRTSCGPTDKFYPLSLSFPVCKPAFPGGGGGGGRELGTEPRLAHPLVSRGERGGCRKGHLVLREGLGEPRTRVRVGCRCSERDHGFRKVLAREEVRPRLPAELCSGTDLVWCCHHGGCAQSRLVRPNPKPHPGQDV